MHDNFILIIFYIIVECTISQLDIIFESYKKVNLHLMRKVFTNLAFQFPSPAAKVIQDLTFRTQVGLFISIGWIGG